MAEALRVTQAYLELPPYFEGLRVTQVVLEVPPVPASEGLRVTQVYTEAPSTRAVVSPPAAAALAAGIAPAISYGVGISGGGPMTATAVGIVPANITTGAIVTISATASAAGIAPSVSGTGGANEALRVTQVVLEMPAFAAAVAAPVGSALAAGIAPSISYGVGVSGGGPMAATAQGFPPAVSVSGGGGIKPPPATAVAGGLAPQVVAGGRVTAPVGTATAQGLAPAFSGGSVGAGHVQVPVGTAVAAGIAPSLIITVSENTPTEGDKQVTVTGPGFTVTVVED